MARIPGNPTETEERKNRKRKPVNRSVTAAIVGLAPVAPVFMLASDGGILLAMLCGVSGNCAIYRIAHLSQDI